ncbi:carbonic anhydrase [Candidatus Macondimonas diazotrophica]|jgi:carbonic anhydrase|uniref:Carbonic anhydrase n=1 Tax=Candidatus Macondimonas diazotrophica TaxID=2305248 RepID=A0A4Z0FB80_9GAMM|nr:carbonic anhydrase family protein [Candidatus Macondimonas diazotrophica]NCT99955.1 carbonic anhydrase family protein [Candidatus Macondimonas diazotrophica]TFZ83753.1 carbonic anhydrase family protein [Candidatus Macondimonas diazotrophica]HBG30618.1 carbonic anhydrase [Gammaproteobacteria bacterium]HBG50931.1 carbonic anhydrase [Gammaproteobacteria bacterium]
MRSRSSMHRVRSNHGVKVAVSVGLVALPVLTAAAPHWDYVENGPYGPSQWGALSSAYETCRSGHSQSPVDVERPVSAALHPLDWHYVPMPAQIVNTGHAMQISPAGEQDESFVLDGHRYHLQQIHFHAPSEHHIKGHAFPLEAHFVHQDEAGHLAVVAVLFDSGPSLPILESLWPAMPEEAGATLDAGRLIDPRELLPQSRGYFRLSGSLTTPPCSEGVLWLILKSHPTVASTQVARLAQLVGGHNNRPIQPRHGRDILE